MGGGRKRAGKRFVTRRHADMCTGDTELQAFIGKPVVVDTDSNMVYVGTLEEVTSSSLVLSDADAHNMTDSSTSKELYVLEARKYGIRPNRSRVWVSIVRMVSISLLDDVIKY